ncbi:MAG TPA: NADH-quinone oxidoreductase subunit D [Armatimonadota bacterium]|jgi:NADH-quinone oxidoreductase subunit D
MDDPTLTLDPEKLRTTVKGDALGDNLQELLVNMGPQHPSTHGVLRLLLHMEGEVVTDAVVHIGYLHRAMEKLCERRNYFQVIPLTDRNDYLCAMTNNQVYCQAVEKLMGLEVPDRAHFIRVIVMELNRIASHLIWLGTFALDLGAMSVFLYCFREREKILSFFEEICGARLTYSYMRIGGVPWDLPEGWGDRVRAFVEGFPGYLEENDQLLTGNEIFLSRTRGIGLLEPEVAVDYGCSGPTLRGSGVAYDVRKAEPYAVYDRLDFDVPVQHTQDCLGRYLVRVAEMRESCRLVRQSLDLLPAGDVMAKTPKTLRPAASEVYTRVESPRGVLGVYLVSDGTTSPYRLKWRAPSFSNLQAIPHMCRGWKIADVVAILGSIDVVLGDVDR